MTRHIFHRNQEIVPGVVYLCEAERRGKNRYITVQYRCGNIADVNLGNILAGKSKTFKGIRKQDLPGFIRLNRGELVAVDLKNWDKLCQYNWYLNNGGYAIRDVSEGSQALLHRSVVRGYVSDWQVDHINGQKLDCRESNLQLVSNRYNCQNKRILDSNTSGNTGVFWDKRRSKWAARIKHKGKQKHLGYFDCLFHAFMVRERAAFVLFENNPRYLRNKENVILTSSVSS